MKVIRQKRGYSINMTDGEFEALCMLVEHGLADFDDKDDYEILSRAGKRAMSTTFSKLGPLSITEDYR